MNTRNVMHRRYANSINARGCATLVEVLFVAKNRQGPGDRSSLRCHRKLKITPNWKKNFLSNALHGRKATTSFGGLFCPGIRTLIGWVLALAGHGCPLEIPRGITGSVDVSVDIGEVKDWVYRADKGEFFRTFIAVAAVDIATEAPLVRKRVAVSLSPCAILRHRLHRRAAGGPAGAWALGLSLGHAGAGLIF